MSRDHPKVWCNKLLAIILIALCIASGVDAHYNKYFQQKQTQTLVCLEDLQDKIWWTKFERHIGDYDHDEAVDSFYEDLEDDIESKIFDLDW